MNLELMEGVKILSTGEMLQFFTTLFLSIAVFSVGIFIVLMLVSIITFFEPRECMIMLLCVILFFISMLGVQNREVVLTYKITIDNSIALEKVLENYEVIDMDGLIYTVMQKE